MKFQNSISATDRHGSVDAVCRRLPYLCLLPASSQETGTCSQRVSSLFPASIHELPYAHFFCRVRQLFVEMSKKEMPRGVKHLVLEPQVNGPNDENVEVPYIRYRIA